MSEQPYEPQDTHESFEDFLGRRVREVWVSWCQEAGDTKESHLLPWENLPEFDKQVDRRIGLALYELGVASRDAEVARLTARVAELEAQLEARTKMLENHQCPHYPTGEGV